MRLSTNLTITIPLSGTVSDAFPLGSARNAVLFVPGLTSCSLAFEASTDTASASFAPLWTIASQAALAIDAGPGSLAAVLKDLVAGVPWARLIASTPQAAVRSFTLITL